mmetsp:Transcript_9128/g.33485  ORF Transcript_9128/g.33485 Transcript_9128/m.33485 type:complete len:318 (+) Transcript_9128:1092-2045(+)
MTSPLTGGMTSTKHWESRRMVPLNTMVCWAGATPVCACTCSFTLATVAARVISCSTCVSDSPPGRTSFACSTVPAPPFSAMNAVSRASLSALVASSRWRRRSSASLCAFATASLRAASAASAASRSRACWASFSSFRRLRSSRSSCWRFSSASFLAVAASVCCCSRRASAASRPSLYCSSFCSWDTDLGPPPSLKDEGPAASCLDLPAAKNLLAKDAAEGMDEPPGAHFLVFTPGFRSSTVESPVVPSSYSSTSSIGAWPPPAGEVSAPISSCMSSTASSDVSCSPFPRSCRSLAARRSFRGSRRLGARAPARALAL